MKKLLVKKINRMGFRRLLVVTFSVGILLLALISAFVTSAVSTRSVSERLEQEGMSLTETAGERSRVALLYLSKTDAKYVADGMLGFPDLKEVSIFDDEKKLLYSTSESVDRSEGHDVWTDKASLVSETRDHWSYVSPVYTGTRLENESSFLMRDAQAELVGYVRVILGKETLKKMEFDIFSYNLLISFTLSALLLAILLAITNRITNPIRELAGIMRRAEEGEKDVRATVKGTRDIVEMETAFNKMLDVLDIREQELKDTRDLALEAARIKGEFAANVSHELRTPLNGVLGMLELLNDMGLNDKQTEYIDIASNSAESLLKLIDDILDFSKIDSGKLDSEEVTFNLDSLLEEIIVLLSTQAQRKDIDLAYLLSPLTPRTLELDKGKLRQVLINLVGNALKFTEQGEVGIEVSVNQRPEGHAELLFKVTDTGIGMSDQARGRIFEAFSQADGSTTRKYGGTGLGLAISKQIVQFMGGTIGADSEPGKGSQFWFTVPLTEPVTGPEVIPERIPGCEKLRVLIIDDSGLNRRYLGGMFDRLGIPYDTAERGAVALDKLRLSAANKEECHLVILDEVMPGLKGSDLAHLLANEPTLANTKILMMLNRVNPTYEEHHNLNVAGFLPKPVMFKDLNVKLQSLYHRKVSSYKPPLTVVKESVAACKIKTFEGNKVLIVEDNRANQQVAYGMLERLGCKSSFVNNGLEALELLSRETFNLVLMDCHMPEMDGYEATSQIRRLESETARVPILAMTANVQKGESEKCLAVGMNDYLSKPLKLESLRTTLGKWLDVKEAVTAQAETGASGNSNEQRGPGEGEAPKADGNDVLNEQVYRELRQQIGSALPTMVKVFLDDIPSYIRSLKDAIKVKDTQAYADFAHSIRSAASNFGANRLCKICAEIETKGRAGISDGMAGNLDKVIAECSLLEIALEQKIGPEGRNDGEDQSFDLLYGISESHAYDHVKPRLLIVDDDRGMRFAMRKVLEKDGYRVDHVNNGHQALAYCERFLPDLVLMDAIMPEMDGFKACSEIQALNGGKQVPILIITALNDETSIGRAFAAGATDYISKPVNFAVLRKRIARILQASRAEKYVLKLAYNDTLTGLPNRTLFTEQLSKTLEEVADQNMAAILFLDLDRFKLVNDTYGHDAGDLLLKVVAERLQRCIRQGDMVSRFGGDEFTIVLNKIKSFSAVEKIASKIHATLSRPFVFLGKEMHVSTSIGISLYPNDGEEIGILLKNADIAMYRAKEKGNCYEFYEKKMEVDIARRLGIETDLRGAITRGEMVVYYQPQEDLKTGELIGMEALVRWQHPVRGLVSPFEFIPLAEETGQIFELGEYVMKTACLQLKKWLDKGQSPIRMAVNLSGRQLESGDIVARVAETLHETGLPAQYLELEITESTIMQNAEEVIETLVLLKKMGVKLAVDDFGTGYSSLNYLKKFPIDLLKIDRAFVSNITNDKVDGDIVTTIIMLAHSLGVKVIAEGVETELQKKYLLGKKCDYMQGYYLGKPVPADEFEKEFLGINQATIQIPPKNITPS
jgi:diguanylate cyclase (GGDEF)-like protein